MSEDNRKRPCILRVLPTVDARVRAGERLPLAGVAFIVTVLAAVSMWRCGQVGNRRKARKVLLGYLAASLLTGIVLPAAVHPTRIVTALARYFSLGLSSAARSPSAYWIPASICATNGR